MITFNTSDYQFLTRCLGEGSLIFKAESIKRLTYLAVNDKKQFSIHCHSILLSIQNLLIEQQQSVNLFATLLLSQIIYFLSEKQHKQLIQKKHLQYVIENLGHMSKPNVRKASHTCLLSFIKTYKDFDPLIGLYLSFGFNNINNLVAQKSINSFQSLLILQIKYYNWKSQQSKILLQNILSKISHQNIFISKASTQCLISMCKIQNFKQTLHQMQNCDLIKLKEFLEQAFIKDSTIQTLITPKYVSEIIQKNIIKVQIQTHLTYPQDEIQKPIDSPKLQKNIPGEIRENTDKQQSIEPKIQFKGLVQEKKTTQDQNFSKIFGNITNQGSIQQRFQAAEQLLYKIQIHKNKPEFQTFVKQILFNLIKLLKDPNPKIIATCLKILNKIIQSKSQNNCVFVLPKNLMNTIIEKLSDQKISIRQMITKFIKDLIIKTDKSQWIYQLSEHLRKSNNNFLKEESLNLIHYIYQQFQISELPFNHIAILEQISQLVEDPKTKIKIRALDCLAQIAFKSSIPQSNNFLRKLPELYYHMYEQKLNILVNQKCQTLSRPKPKIKIWKDEIKMNNYNNDIANKLKAQTQNNEKEALNSSVDNKYLLPKNNTRNVLSTQQTVSLSLDNTIRTIDRSAEDIEFILPSLDKKAKFNHLITRKTQFSSTSNTIEGRNSKYLGKEQLKPLRQPEKQIKSIISDLKSSDWKIQFQTINKIRRICQFSPELFSNLLPNIHLFILDLLVLIESLRSSVSKNALICLNEFISVMKKKIDPYIEIILQKLIKKSVDNNSFISSEVQRCLYTLSSQTSEAKFLQKIMIYKDSKSFLIKQACINTLLYMKDQQTIKQKQFLLLVQNFILFLGEPQIQIRNKAKQGLLSLCQSEKNWQKILKPYLNSVVFDNLRQFVVKSTNEHVKKVIDNQSIHQQETSIKRLPTKKQELFKLKIVNFPNQFNQINGYLDETNSNDWKKRLESLNKIKKIALNFPLQFCQYKSSPHFLDTIGKQFQESNLKVSINALQSFLQLVSPLNLIIQKNISTITSSLFNVLSISKTQVRQLAEQCIEKLIQNVQMSILIQHICHGIIYSLPKSRIYLISKLNALLPSIYLQKKPLLFKYIFPTLNKLINENKVEIMGDVIILLKSIEYIMGNSMFNYLNKFKEIKQLLGK